MTRFCEKEKILEHLRAIGMYAATYPEIKASELIQDIYKWIENGHADWQEEA